MKIAFASRDGAVVAQHFGRATRFEILKINERQDFWYRYETRETDAPCGLGEHDDEKLDKSVALISDCKALFTVKAGEYAKVKLAAAGVQVLEKPGFIEDLIEEYIRYLNRPLFGAKKRRDVMDDHPCFSAKAHNKNGRVHLPVSPACNIACRFCTRAKNTDETRPGVAAGILEPEEAVETVRRALHLCPEITVVGIAGPGDTLATDHAMETFRRVHDAFPHLINCLSTNGLALPGQAEALRRVGVRTITVTVNAVEEKILARVVSWIQGEGDLIAAQLRGIRECADAGLFVKINTVLIPGVNDAHVADIARATQAAGAARHNIIPLIPQNEFTQTPAPTCEQIEKARQEAGVYLEQFRHCQHCRADACGIPGGAELSKALYENRVLETFSHG